MALPGVKINVLDGNLALQAPSNEQTVVYLGPSLSGANNTLSTYGDITTLQSALSGSAAIGGELVELAGYGLSVSGTPVMVMPTNTTTRGGVGAVTHVGTGAGTVTLTLAPHVSITITCVAGGTLGTAQFTFTLGSGTASAPVTSAASWSTTGYFVGGTYCNVVFVAGTYISAVTPDIYVISTLGAVTHPQGSGPVIPTFTASPVDYFTPLLTITTAGSPGTAQFTYALDYGANAATANTSATIITPAGGAYAIPNTGIVATFAGAFVVNDTYAFSAAGPSPNTSDLTAAFTALTTTYLAQATYSMAAVVASNASAAAWATQCASLETQSLTLFNAGVYVRMFNGCPTIGTVLPNVGGITVDAADTDSVVVAARAGISAPHVVGCAGDWVMTSPVTGLSFRRNAMWAAVGRSSSHEASENIGAVQDGGIAGAVSLIRDENATPAFDAAGITCMRTFTGAGANGIYMTDGHTSTTPTSDYFPLTNARVIDRACAIARLNALPLVLSKIPTTTRNGLPGVITERKAQQIEGMLKSALETAMVDTQPADAVAVGVQVSRTHNILADGNLIIQVAVQPFAYARIVVVNIGLAVQA
jgi:hypothetical protein